MCIFCQIINKELPSTILFEDEDLVVFKDINPSAPVHLLVVPKEHIVSLAEMGAEDEELVGKLVYRAKLMAEEAGISQSGYKVVINTGRGGGQIVDHLHVHLLGGWEPKV